MNEIQQYLDVLELSPDAEWDDVTQAYRELIKIWHPDRFSHDEKLKGRAELKSKQLNEAVRQLRRHYRRTRLYKRSEINDAVNGAVNGANSGIFRTVKPNSQQWQANFGRGKVEQRYNASQSGAAIYQALQKKEKRVAQLTRFATAAITITVLALIAAVGIPAIPKIKIFELNPEQLPSARPLNDYRVVSLEPGYIPAGEQTEAKRDLVKSGLIEAVAACKLETVDTLLRSGVNVNEVDSNGDSPLAWAARRNCLGAAQKLLRAGADTKTVARNGFTARDWGIWAKSWKVVELLPKG